MPYDINHLRTELFDTLKRLKDKDHPLDIDQAKAIVAVAGVIVDTARVEVAMIEASGEGDTGFIKTRSTSPVLPPGTPARPQLAAGGRRQ